jgi:hypothetical protein
MLIVSAVDEVNKSVCVWESVGRRSRRRRKEESHLCVCKCWKKKPLKKERRTALVCVQVLEEEAAEERRRMHRSITCVLKWWKKHGSLWKKE